MRATFSILLPSLSRYEIYIKLNNEWLKRNKKEILKERYSTIREHIMELYTEESEKNKKTADQMYFHFLKQIKLVETENTLLKVNAGSKPDLSILEKVSGGLRAHIGFHPTSAAGSPYWHLGLSGFESAVHIPLVPIVSIVKGITSYNTYNSNLVNFDDK